MRTGRPESRSARMTATPGAGLSVAFRPVTPTVMGLSFEWVMGLLRSEGEALGQHAVLAQDLDELAHVRVEVARVDLEALAQAVADLGAGQPLAQRDQHAVAGRVRREGRAGVRVEHEAGLADGQVSQVHPLAHGKLRALCLQRL